MAKKLQLIDLTKIKKSHHLFITENQGVLTEAKEQLQKYDEFKKSVDYNTSIIDLLKNNKDIPEEKKIEFDKKLEQDLYEFNTDLQQVIKEHKHQTKLAEQIFNNK